MSKSYKLKPIKSDKVFGKMPKANMSGRKK